MLARGWMLTLGSLSIFWLAFIVLVWLSTRFNNVSVISGELQPYIFGAIVAAPLVIPGIATELKWRRQERERKNFL